MKRFFILLVGILVGVISVSFSQNPKASWEQSSDTNLLDEYNEFVSEEFLVDTGLTLNSVRLYLDWEVKPPKEPTIHLMKRSSTNTMYEPKLRGYWKFEDTTWKDESRYGNNLIAVGNPTVTVGRFGNAVDFSSGTNQFLYISDDLQKYLDCDKGQGLTVSCWVKFPSYMNEGSSYLPLIYKTTGSLEGYALYVNHLKDYPDYQPKWQGITFTTGTQSAGDYNQIFNLNTWYHLVGRCVAAKGEVSVFLNGLENLTNKVTNHPFDLLVDNKIPFAIGGYYYAGQWWANFPKIIDEVAIWNRPLTNEEIMTVYTSGVDAVAKRKSSVAVLKQGNNIISETGGYFTIEIAGSEGGILKGVSLIFR